MSGETGGADSASPSLQGRLRLGAQIAAAALTGFGLILWVAAHWDEISRFGRFGIVGGVLAASLLISLINAARVPGLILSFLATGGLFALIGQTYQTGADPWQLFAVWAAVGLPWALAGRSDALWVVWSVVAHVAIGLWLATFARVGWWTLDPGVTIMGWAMALAVTGLLSPVIRPKSWVGDTNWSFRLSMLLTIGLVTQAGVAALFAGRDVSIVYWLALFLLGGLAYGLIVLPKFDIVVIAVMGLSLDTMLIGGFSRAVFTGSRDATLPFLLIGVVGAALVAGTGSLILRMARERANVGFDMDALKGREWPVILMTGIGALLTTVPLSGFLGLVIGPFLTTGAGAYVVGAIFLAGAVFFLRTTRQTTFQHQLAAIALTLGYCLIAYGLFRDARGATSAVNLTLALLAVGLAIAVGRSWTAGLLGGAAAFFSAALLNSLLHLPIAHIHIPSVIYPRGWILVLAIAAAWYVLTALSARDEEDGASRLPFADSIERFLGGYVTAGLFGVMATAGPTFLLSGAMGGIGPSRHLVTGLQLSWSSLSLLSAALACAGCAWLLVPRPRLQTTLGLGASLIVIALAAIMPSLGILVLLLCIAFTSGRRTVGVGAFIAALWVLGSFYYWLGWPLSDKAALMTSAGVMLAALCWFSGIRRADVGLASGIPAPALLARGLIIAGALATGGLAAQSITTNEAIIATGRQIFLALAPVDPRSLIQGDFMRLNFAVPNQRRIGRNDASVLGQRRWAIATVDDRDVATVESVVEVEPGPVAANQIVLPMRYKERRWIVGTDAWFFKEGTAEKWQQARFGLLRVGANGTALLVGMADKDLGLIK
ncbi:MAG: GDYXXLXY domain-containing protein [Hyphomicrobiaceae bacterium]